MIATLYDIHGNLAALEAVLAEIPDDATIVVGGDVCAGGDNPSETLGRLRGMGERVLWVRGNGDRELTPGEKGLAPPGALDDTRAKLTGEQIAFLHELPPTQQVGRTHYCHASPCNDVDIFTELTPEDHVAPLFADVDADVVVCGHTHMQFEREIGTTVVINSGSVGYPYEDRPGAYWTLDLAHRFTPYDGAPEPGQSRDEHLKYFTDVGL